MSPKEAVLSWKFSRVTSEWRKKSDEKTAVWIWMLPKKHHYARRHIPGGKVFSPSECLWASASFNNGGIFTLSAGKNTCDDCKGCCLSPLKTIQPDDSFCRYGRSPWLENFPCTKVSFGDEHCRGPMVAIKPGRMYFELRWRSGVPFPRSLWLLTVWLARVLPVFEAEIGVAVSLKVRRESLLIPVFWLLVLLLTQVRLRDCCMRRRNCRLVSLTTFPFNVSVNGIRVYTEINKTVNQANNADTS